MAADGGARDAATGYILKTHHKRAEAAVDVQTAAAGEGQLAELHNGVDSAVGVLGGSLKEREKRHGRGMSAGVWAG